jgi:hypothetical protein
VSQPTNNIQYLRVTNKVDSAHHTDSRRLKPLESRLIYSFGETKLTSQQLAIGHSLKLLGRNQGKYIF